MNTNSSAIVLLGKGPYVKEYLNLIRKLNLKANLIVCSYIKPSPGNNHYEYVKLQQESELNTILNYVKKNNYKVIAVLNRVDQFEEIHGALCDELDLPGPSRKAVNLISNKDALHESMIKNGLGFYRPRTIKTSIVDLSKHFENVQFPVVIKPADGAKSRGVVKIESKDDIESAISIIENYIDNDETILIENYIEGSQVAPVCFVDMHGKVQSLNFVDITSGEDIGHSHMQLIYRTIPSKLTKSIKSILISVIQKVCDYSELKSVCLHPEFIISRNDVYLIEVNVRIAGYRDELMQYACGISMSEVSLMLALGREVLVSQTKTISATACEIWDERSGVIDEVNLPDNRYVVSKKIHFKQGDIFTAPPNDNKQLATFFVVHPEDSLSVAREVRKAAEINFKA